MAVYCGKCGSPFGPDAKFCPACGTARTDGAAAAVSAPLPQSTPEPAQSIPAKSGSSALKILAVVLILGFGAVVIAGVGAVYFGKKKFDHWRQGNASATTTSPDAAPGNPSEARSASSHSASGSPLLSKEEVGSIIGVPVTSIEMQGRDDAHYKTDTVGMEASIEVEQRGGVDEAIQSMAAARTVTKSAFGGKAAPVVALGDEAVYGAFNVLYVRKNDLFLTIMPPNLKQVAQMKQYNDMTSQPMGSDAQVKSLQKLADMQKGDPAAGSLSKPDAASGAIDLIQHAATEQGDEYETKARAMARQMAEKVLAKI